MQGVKRTEKEIEQKTKGQIFTEFRSVAMGKQESIHRLLFRPYDSFSSYQLYYGSSPSLS